MLEGGRRELLVPMPDACELGPAMNALNDQQRAFVVAFVVMGASATAAARAAGYKIDGNPASVRVQAYRLVHDSRVQAAITEEAQRRLKGMVPSALKAVQEAIENPQHCDRLKASFGVLNRAGLHEVAERNVNVTVKMTKEEEISRIRELADKLGLDANQLLGKLRGRYLGRNRSGPTEARGGLVSVVCSAAPFYVS